MEQVAHIWGLVGKARTRFSPLFNHEYNLSHSRLAKLSLSLAHLSPSLFPCCIEFSVWEIRTTFNNKINSSQDLIKYLGMKLWRQKNLSYILRDTVLEGTVKILDESLKDKVYTDVTFSLRDASCGESLRFKRWFSNGSSGPGSRGACFLTHFGSKLNAYTIEYISKKII